MDVPLLVELGGEMHGLVANVTMLFVVMLVKKVLPLLMYDSYIKFVVNF